MCAELSQSWTNQLMLLPNSTNHLTQRQSVFCHFSSDNFKQYAWSINEWIGQHFCSFAVANVFFNNKRKLSIDSAAADGVKAFNDTHRVLQCFTQFNIRMAVSDLFHVFTKSIKFYTFYYHIVRSTDIWKMWFIKLTVKINDCSFQQVLQQNLGWFLS